MRKLQVDDNELIRTAFQFQRDATGCRMRRSAQDKDPVLLHVLTCRSVVPFGAVNRYTGQVLRHFSAMFDAQTFKCFLKQVLRYRRDQRRTIVALDSARYRHVALPSRFLRRRAKRVHLPFIRRGSLQLVLIAPVLKLARCYMSHNRHIPTFEDVVKAVRTYSDLPRRPSACGKGNAALLESL